LQSSFLTAKIQNQIRATEKSQQLTIFQPFQRTLSDF